MGAREKGREGTRVDIQELQSLRELFTCSNYSMCMAKCMTLLLRLYAGDIFRLLFLYRDCSEFPVKFQGSIVLGYVQSV